MGRFTDFGAGGGRWAVKGIRGHTQGKCPKCGKISFVSRQAWHRVKQPECSHCGERLEPSKQAQEENKAPSSSAPLPQGSRCVLCGTKLSYLNHRSYPHAFCRLRTCNAISEALSINRPCNEYLAVVRAVKSADGRRVIIELDVYDDSKQLVLRQKGVLVEIDIADAVKRFGGDE